MNETSTQDSIFLNGEGDAWYRRNAPLLSSRQADAMISVLSHLDRRDEVRSICDLGCADGWRLAILRPMLPNARRFAGVDPSAEAIGTARAKWPDFELVEGTLAENPLQGSFDLVLVNAVLHWVDRAALAASILGIDRLVAPGGVLVIADFAADAPTSVPYHHRTDVAVLTYKQNYSECFKALGLYRETFRLERAHDDLSPELSVPSRIVDERNRWSVSVLVKAE